MNQDNITIEISTRFDKIENSTSRNVSFVSANGLSGIAACLLGYKVFWQYNRNIVSDTIDLPDGLHTVERRFIGPDPDNFAWKPVDQDDSRKYPSDLLNIRHLMDKHPLPENENPPRWRSQIQFTENTALLKLVGPLVYTLNDTAQWIWANLPSGSFYHESNHQTGHKTVFLATSLPTVVHKFQLAGKQTLIV